MSKQKGIFMLIYGLRGIEQNISLWGQQEGAWMIYEIWPCREAQGRKAVRVKTVLCCTLQLKYPQNNLIICYYMLLDNKEVFP